MRYHDTGNRSPDQTLGKWLLDGLQGATYFGCQTGYFSADGIAVISSELKDILAAGGTVELVIGSNEGGVLSSDLRAALQILAAGDGTLRIAGAADVLMHPKTFYIEGPQGRRLAFVGSANLTSRGLDGNIEAGISLDENDDPTALDAVRDAIAAWRSHSNAVVVTDADLPQLITDGVVDRPAPPPPALDPTQRQRQRQRFPALGRILRRAAIGGGGAVPAAAPVGRPHFPNGAVGIVKELSALDTKAFHGGRGTPYIALPADLAAFLQMAPYGRNHEPRVDVDLEGLLDSIPGVAVPHVNTRGNTNITWTGAGAIQRSHRDLRLNYLQPITKGLLDAARRAAVRPPQAGDAAVVEFLSPTAARLHFVTLDPELSRLLRLAHATGEGWNWIAARDLPR